MFRSVILLAKPCTQSAEFKLSGCCLSSIVSSLTHISCMSCGPLHSCAFQHVAEKSNPMFHFSKMIKTDFFCMARMISITLLEGENVGAKDPVVTPDIIEQGFLQSNSGWFLYPRCLVVFGTHQV